MLIELDDHFDLELRLLTIEVKSHFDFAFIMHCLSISLYERQYGAIRAFYFVERNDSKQCSIESLLNVFVVVKKNKGNCNHTICIFLLWWFSFSQYVSIGIDSLVTCHDIYCDKMPDCTQMKCCTGLIVMEQE